MSKLKIITVVALVVVISASMFSSCKKDGVYNPKKKINKIYSQNSKGEKILSETWTWDNDKLMRIDYGGGFEVFEYDKDKLIKFTYNNGNYEKYTYNGSKIDKVELWNKEGNDVLIEYKFEYTENKISKISSKCYISFDDMETSLNNQKNNALRFVLPEQIANIISIPFENKLKNRKTSETVSITMELTWKGDNIEKVIYISNYNSLNLSSTEIFHYTYDNKLNPMYGYLNGRTDATSKNNVKKMIMTDGNEPSLEEEYSYVYDGKFPTEITRTQTLGTHKSTSVTYYEYK